MSVYTCRRCEYSQDLPWELRCPGCGGLYRSKKVGVETKEQKNRSSFAAAAVSTTVYIPTGVAGFDRVIGGGLVAGSPILLAGFRGCGKSTLLCLIADGIAKLKGGALYASSEESVEGVVSIANRLKLTNVDVDVLGNQHSVEKVIAHIKATKPFLSIYDSLQKYVSEYSSGSPGSISQEKAVSEAILNHCRETKTCAIVVNQMDKQGEIKGSTEAQHAVDTVLMLGFPKDDDEDAPDEEGVRVLVCDGKNRNGNEKGKSFWRMTDDGMLEEVQPKSRLIENPLKGKYSRG